MLSITVNKHNAEQRLDRFLRKAFPKASLSLLFAIIRKKKVRVNGVIGKAAQMLCENDVLQIYENLPQTQKKESFKQEIANLEENLNFVLQNSDFAVLNKPCGLASQSGSGISEDESLAGMLALWAMEEGLDFKPALVHRLDKETSGLIIAALSGYALREFGKMLRERKIKKEYLALVKGKMPQKSGKISMALPGDEKISESVWKVEKSFENCDLVRVGLETGRKHQIRIHFAQTGHPLLGDSRHGDFALNRKFKRDFGLSRLFLHSAYLEFNWQGKKIKLEAELPVELGGILKILGAI
ncbi:MAG: RluA family pseudouridine synthase [Candidatus Fibromonas sp.]|nr:RluA family pseudouridine synthase [Candidatus Fibromonas sp.]